MKPIIKIAAFACLFLLSIKFADAQNSLVHLNWKLAPQDDKLYTEKQVSVAGFKTTDWIKAVVPGTVFYSYVVAGKESNPDYADNIYKVDKAKYNRPFWYRAEFSAQGFPAGKRIWLNFNGINKRGEVYFNGQSHWYG